MSLEAYRSRLRALELAAQKLATSADCSGTSEPELIQIAMHFHPAEGTSTREAAAVAWSATSLAVSTSVRIREVSLRIGTSRIETVGAELSRSRP